VRVHVLSRQGPGDGVKRGAGGLDGPRDLNRPAAVHSDNRLSLRACGAGFCGGTPLSCSPACAYAPRHRPTAQNAQPNSPGGTSRKSWPKQELHASRAAKTRILLAINIALFALDRARTNSVICRVAFR
jgi:hypothetical protein